MIYKTGDRVFVQQGDSILKGILYTSEPLVFAEDESGFISGYAGPEFVEIESQGKRTKLRAENILTLQELAMMKI